MLGRPVGKYAYSRPLDKICLVRMRNIKYAWSRPVGKYAYSRPVDKICLVRM